MRPLHIVIAPDSFKGSASSSEICNYMKEGVLRAAIDADIHMCAIADGGEGTLDALLTAQPGKLVACEVQDPLGKNIQAQYALLADKTAVIETAKAAGLCLIEQTQENALCASTFGVGQLILDALMRGARKIVLGLGGSATSDGGCGMASALGIKFLTQENAAIAPGVKGLLDLDHIDISKIHPKVKECEFILLDDVENPLAGPSGALYTFGPQKGIKEDMLAKLDTAMFRYAHCLVKAFGRDVSYIPGAGAAGGMGAPLIAMGQAKQISGIDYILDCNGFDSLVADADLVLTGEGRMDGQTILGKAPVGVAKRARKHKAQVIAIVGSRAEDLTKLYAEGISLVLTCQLGPQSLEESLNSVAKTVPVAAETAIRAYMMSTERQKRL